MDGEIDGYYPEGGTQGWLRVFGSFMGLGSGVTGWIFGLFTFLTFFRGIQIGPIFDARGPRLLVFLGAILIMVMVVGVGFCREYWQFILAMGVAGGVRTSLIFTPSIAAVGHFFRKKRSLATGIAVSGGSIGGVIIPLTLESLFDKYGFAWATRVAMVCFLSLAIASALVSSRLPTKPFSKENILPGLRILQERKFLLTMLSMFFIEWDLFIPITYISFYALAHGLPTKLSYQLLAILNAGSFFGRMLPGFLADSLGRFTTLLITVAFYLACNVCLWMPAGSSVALLIVYCALFGFASGSIISLTPVCIGQLCRTEHVSKYV
ncbi:major facilitator superfamily domain-containing protein [Aspergillus terricola var. indicus]